MFRRPHSAEVWADMTLLASTLRVWRGTDHRTSRFHNEKGYFALNSASEALDCATSLATTTARLLSGYRPEVPWITMPAFRFLRRHLPANARVFEWSSGMSTLWFEKHCAEVISVEDDEKWFRMISKRLHKARLSHKTGTEYVQAITEFQDGSFDLISVDGSHRLACFEIAHRYLKPGGILLVDNTDKDRQTRGDMWHLDAQIERSSEYEVHRFPGWIHGIWAPIETTICLHRGKAETGAEDS